MTVYRQNISPAPDCMVKGFPVDSVRESFLIKSVAHEFMARHGFSEFTVDDWCPMQSYLSLLRDIKEHLGKDSLYKLGRAIPYVIEVDLHLLRNVEAALQGINIAYYSVHKGSDIGTYEVEIIGPDDYQVICNTPYDHTLDHGIITSFVERAKARQVWNVEMLPMANPPDIDNRGVFTVRRV